MGTQRYGKPLNSVDFCLGQADIHRVTGTISCGMRHRSSCAPPAVAFWFIGFETKGVTFEEMDNTVGRRAAASP